MSGVTQYLLALYILEHRREPPIQTNVVAETLDKSPASVTAMFQRLENDEFVTYEPYKGATLTDAGRERAATLHETYVTVSWFFRSVLDLDTYEAEAMELAGFLSPTVAKRLAATLPYGVEATTRSEESSPVVDDDFT